MKIHFAGLALAVFSTALSTVRAQAAASPDAVAPHVMRTYHLVYSTTSTEQTEVVTAIRNIASSQLRVFVVPSRNDIAAVGSAEDLKIVEDLLAKLDVPHKLYRLTYTFIESDAGKRIGVEHYTMTLAPGQRMQMKQGSRVPLVVSKAAVPVDPGKQVAYLDVGLNFDSEVNEYGTGVRLKSKVEQSSLADEKSGLGPEDPVLRQTILEGTTTLVEGKPSVLGALDVTGSTRHIEVEALIEAVK